MDRGVSTVLDVAIACLLVTSAATLLVSTPAPPVSPPDPAEVGRAILLSTVPVESGAGSTTTSVGDLLVHAAVSGTLEPAHRRQIADRIEAVGPRIQLVVPEAEPDIVIGATPPRDAAVDAMVFGVPVAGRRPVDIVVRTWAR